jgi:two-component system response regulator AtoC
MTQRRGDVGEESIDLPFGAVPPAISCHHSHERGDNNRGAPERRSGHIRGIILVGPTLWLIHDVFGPITQMLQADPVDVLTSVARLVAEAPSLREVVAGLAGTLRAPIPFDRLHVLRLDRADSFVLYTASETGGVEVTKHLVGDPATQMDAVDDAARSRIVCTIRQGARVHGALWLTSPNEDAFCTAHQKLMDSVVDLLGLAFEHDAIVERDKLRRERIDSLRGLLQTMAGALDIRRVFDEVSEVVRGGLPHDMLVITSWGADGTSFRIYAMAGAAAEPDFFEAQPLSGDDLAQLQRDAYVIHDADTEVPPTSLRGKIFRRFGVRSALRVLMPLGTRVFGSLFFLSWQTDRFSEEDVDFARRVADHLALALSHEQLAEAARRQAESRETAARLEAQVATLTRELESRTGHRRVVGQSKQWKDVLAHAARVAHTETTVLLTGESGTGKEVVARFIHHASRRSQGPFVAINCAALPDQLLESELFGHERGAFTGAVSAKPGRIEQANGGVLFLDEVGEMAPTVQAKLLRVLEEREFMRLGSTRALHADIRVIAATNRDLHAAMQRGEFREDLYYRLGVFEISLPPLRARLDDVLELADSFLAEIGETVGRPAAGISRDAREHLLTYEWPGNVRELRNAIERAVILADGGFIRSEHLPVTPRRAGRSDDHTAANLPAGGVNLEDIERSLVVKALTQARHNKTRAAKLLGLTRAQLYSRIEKYGLTGTES